MNSNLKLIFSLKQTWKHIWQFYLLFLLLLLLSLLLSFSLFYVLLVSQNPVLAIALLPKRLFFRSTIMKAWHHLWARWRINTQERQFTRVQDMVFIVDNADNNGNSAALLGDYYSSCSTCSAEPEVSPGRDSALLSWWWQISTNLGTFFKWSVFLRL